MFVAINDNLTLKEFKANVEPGVSVAKPDLDALTFYTLTGPRNGNGQPFQLMRFGMTKIDRRMTPQRGAFPTAASPHPFCPEHTYTPPTAVRPPVRSPKPALPSYLRVVA